MTLTKTLTMDRPVELSLLDGAQHVIGRPIARIDGPLKVTGSATYSAEYDLPNLAYGVLVGTNLGSGKVMRVDERETRALPGILDVVSVLDGLARDAHRDHPTHGSSVRYYHEPVALVVGETFEAARAGAMALSITCASAAGRYDFAANLGETDRPPDGVTTAFSEQGDLDEAMREAAVTIDGIWTTPSQHSAAMEPTAAIATWDDGKLTVYGTYQRLALNRKQLASAMGMDPQDVRILAPFVGGGFGGKLDVGVEATYAAFASRRLRRPIKVVMARQQVFDATVRRPSTRQRLRLGASMEGRLVAVGHETITSNLPDENWFEMSGVATHFLYAGANRRISHELVRMNLLRAASMRAPGEGSGMLALEGAMDELAEKLELDPIDLRRINEPAVDPESGKRFSTRHLVACMDEGARRFGWASRNRRPGALRRGACLIGHGMAVAARTNKLMASKAPVSLTPAGKAVVETDMTDIGTGTYTILAQITGEMLGLPMESVEVWLGDTRLPAAAGSGGSVGANSCGSSVYLACEVLRSRLAQAMGATLDDMTLKDAHVIAGNRRLPIASLVGSGLTADGEIVPGRTKAETMQSAFGAHFCEVAVDAYTCEVRVTRWLSVITAGRILNERTARSQCIGGITFGIGGALSEELLVDSRDGSVVNRDLAGYEVPVHADIPDLEVVFLSERDPFANPMHTKGIGELGVAGSGAAVANAVYNATGVRIRNFPIRLDMLIPSLSGLKASP